MTIRKDRITITVDAELIRAGHEAVQAGHADSLSSWVNLALTERVERERRLGAMARAVLEYEAKFGEISADEIEAQSRADARASRAVGGDTHVRRKAKTTARRRGARK